MEIVKNPLPPEILEYKDQHVWPLKTLYNTACARGALDHLEIAWRLEAALSKYITFMHEYAKRQPNYDGLLEGPLGMEIEWAFDECDQLSKLVGNDFIQMPVRKAGKRVVDKTDDN
jgi:hypothetical protein